MTVHLVGAGPGDPGLLTRRGAELLAAADVVVFDRLVDPSVLALCRAGATLIDVGKWPAERSAPGGRSQEEINDLLIEQARAGRRVVRLKGGDPFLFGRGGEEVAALQRAGVPVSVVAGVPSAFAVPASAGVPVTYRGLAGAVTVVTGQGGGPGSGAALDWEALARTGGTIVVLMGAATRGVIAERLLAAGLAATTPVAVVERGTTAAARIERSTLGGLGDLRVEAPATIVIGAVAALDLGPPGGPLSGWSVVVTRATERSGRLREALEAAGASVVSLPVIETVDPDDGGSALERAAGDAPSYDWIAFTSAAAVERFVPLVGDLRRLGGVQLAAVGPATAGALSAFRLVADLVPAASTGADLAQAMPRAPSGGRVLFPKAAGAAPDLEAGLSAKGWTVDAVVAYRTVPAPRPGPAVAEGLARADAVTFTSPSTVAAYAGEGDAPALPVPPVVVCIGPKTTAAARAAGLHVTAEAATATAEGLVEALIAWRRHEEQA